MTDAPVLLDLSDGVATITLNRPEAMNSLDVATKELLLQVVREVAEEAGVVVERPRYLSSQPWPFPRSLMMGYTARAVGETERTDDEIAVTRWFTRAELAQRAFGHDYEALERTIDVHVMNLRRKIEPDRSRRPAVLVTVFGTGYRLEAVRAAD